MQTTPILGDCVGPTTERAAFAIPPRRQMGRGAECPKDFKAGEGRSLRARLLAGPSILVKAFGVSGVEGGTPNRTRPRSGERRGARIERMRRMRYRTSIHAHGFEPFDRSLLSVGSGSASRRPPSALRRSCFYKKRKVGASPYGYPGGLAPKASEASCL